MTETSLTDGCRTCRLVTRLAGFFRRVRQRKSDHGPRNSGQLLLLDSTHVAALLATGRGGEDVRPNTGPYRLGFAGSMAASSPSAQASLQMVKTCCTMAPVIFQPLGLAVGRHDDECLSPASRSLSIAGSVCTYPRYLPGQAPSVGRALPRLLIKEILPQFQKVEEVGMAPVPSDGSQEAGIAPATPAYEALCFPPRALTCTGAFKLS